MKLIVDNLLWLLVLSTYTGILLFVLFGMQSLEYMYVIMAGYLVGIAIFVERSKQCRK